MIVSVATTKMTGLDLGPPPVTSSSSSSSSTTSSNTHRQDDESLTTPKVEPSSGGGLPSPRLNSSRGEDMLTTPVLTTPKTAEYWSTLGKDIPFSPTSIVSVPPPPPKELPMDSDIGLRSPCDGLLHKRRMFKNKINSGNSVNSDSNSCDTPGSDNSPRDLSVSSGVVKEEMEEDSRYNNSTSSSSVSSLRRQISKPEGGLNNKNVVNFQQSPLAVPSPNWNVVERYIGVEILKTPKLLDNSFFDFLVSPSTPKNGKISGNRDISPGSEADRYSGRDQRLSPRLSPRFPIPEAPTDLSKSNNSHSGDRIPPLSRIAHEEDPYEAEDLSMSKQNNNNNNNNVPLKGRTPSPAHSPPSSIQSIEPCKQEYSPSSNSALEPALPPSKTIKTEIESNNTSSNNIYDYHRQNTIGHPPGAAGFPHPLYFQHQFHSALYHRQIYSELQQQQQGGGGGGHQMMNHRSSPVMESSYDAYQSPQQGHPSQQHHAAAALHWSQQQQQRHHWTIPSNNNDDSAMEEDNSSSSSPPYHKGPPPTISVKPPSALLHNSELGKSPESKKATSLKKKSSVKHQDPSNSSKSSEKPRSKDGVKRTYICPHCQRSYDWNYNLNRHLKYECGKENAFQCAKCSRKFPHKQNCVYHLKRKHKIVCESIDRYVSKGFVIFQGASSSSSSSSPPSSSLSGHLSSGHLNRESIATSS